MAMLFYALLLCLASWSVDARSDYTSSIQPTTYTSFGRWGNADWCAEGLYAYGFRLKVERGMGKGFDDTALNGIQLLCKSNSTGINQIVTSYIGKWGSWGNTTTCGADYFLHGAQARSEKFQGGGYLSAGNDDTAVNNYNFLCKNTKNTATQILHGHGLSWGSWTSRRDCPSGLYICGIKTLVEPDQDWRQTPDNTALNNAIFYCCTLKATQC